MSIKLKIQYGKSLAKNHLEKDLLHLPDWLKKTQANRKYLLQIQEHIQSQLKVGLDQITGNDNAKQKARADFFETNMQRFQAIVDGVFDEEGNIKASIRDEAIKEAFGHLGFEPKIAARLVRGTRDQEKAGKGFLESMTEDEERQIIAGYEDLFTEEASDEEDLEEEPEEQKADQSEEELSEEEKRQLAELEEGLKVQEPPKETPPPPPSTIKIAGINFPADHEIHKHTLFLAALGDSNFAIIVFKKPLAKYIEDTKETTRELFLKVIKSAFSKKDAYSSVKEDLLGLNLSPEATKKFAKLIYLENLLLLNPALTITSDTDKADLFSLLARSTEEQVTAVGKTLKDATSFADVKKLWEAMLPPEATKEKTAKTDTKKETKDEDNTGKKKPEEKTTATEELTAPVKFSTIEFPVSHAIYQHKLFLAALDSKEFSAGLLSPKSPRKIIDSFAKADSGKEKSTIEALFKITDYRLIQGKLEDLGFNDMSQRLQLAALVHIENSLLNGPLVSVLPHLNNNEFFQKLAKKPQAFVDQVMTLVKDPLAPSTVRILIRWGVTEDIANTFSGMDSPKAKSKPSGDESIKIDTKDTADTKSEEKIAEERGRDFYGKLLTAVSGLTPILRLVASNQSVIQAHLAKQKTFDATAFVDQLCFDIFCRYMRSGGKVAAVQDVLKEYLGVDVKAIDESIAGSVVAFAGSKIKGKQPNYFTMVTEANSNAGFKDLLTLLTGDNPYDLVFAQQIANNLSKKNITSLAAFLDRAFQALINLPLFPVDKDGQNKVVREEVAKLLGISAEAGALNDWEKLLPFTAAQKELLKTKQDQNRADQFLLHLSAWAYTIGDYQLAGILRSTDAISIERKLTILANYGKNSVGEVVEITRYNEGTDPKFKDSFENLLRDRDTLFKAELASEEKTPEQDKSTHRFFALQLKKEIIALIDKDESYSSLKFLLALLNDPANAAKVEAALAIKIQKTPTLTAAVFLRDLQIAIAQKLIEKIEDLSYRENGEKDPQLVAVAPNGVAKTMFDADIVLQASGVLREYLGVSQSDILTNLVKSPYLLPHEQNYVLLLQAAFSNKNLGHEMYDFLVKNKTQVLGALELRKQPITLAEVHQAVLAAVMAVPYETSDEKRGPGIIGKTSKKSEGSLKHDQQAAITTALFSSVLGIKDIKEEASIISIRPGHIFDRAYRDLKQTKWGLLFDLVEYVRKADFPALANLLADPQQANAVLSKLPELGKSKSASVIHLLLKEFSNELINDIAQSIGPADPQGIGVIQKCLLNKFGIDASIVTNFDAVAVNIKKQVLALANNHKLEIYFELIKKLRIVGLGGVADALVNRPYESLESILTIEAANNEERAANFVKNWPKAIASFLIKAPAFDVSNKHDREEAIIALMSKQYKLNINPDAAKQIWEKFLMPPLAEVSLRERIESAQAEKLNKSQNLANFKVNILDLIAKKDSRFASFEFLPKLFADAENAAAFDKKIAERFQHEPVPPAQFLSDFQLALAQIVIVSGNTYQKQGNNLVVNSPISLDAKKRIAKKWEVDFGFSLPSALSSDSLANLADNLNLAPHEQSYILLLQKVLRAKELGQEMYVFLTRNRAAVLAKLITMPDLTLEQINQGIAARVMAVEKQNQSEQVHAYLNETFFSHEEKAGSAVYQPKPENILSFVRSSLSPAEWRLQFELVQAAREKGYAAFANLLADPDQGETVRAKLLEILKKYGYKDSEKPQNIDALVARITSEVIDQLPEKLAYLFTRTVYVAVPEDRTVKGRTVIGEYLAINFDIPLANALAAADDVRKQMPVAPSVVPCLGLYLNLIEQAHDKGLVKFVAALEQALYADKKHIFSGDMIIKISQLSDMSIDYFLKNPFPRRIAEFLLSQTIEDDGHRAALITLQIKEILGIAINNDTANEIWNFLPTAVKQRIQLVQEAKDQNLDGLAACLSERKIVQKMFDDAAKGAEAKEAEVKNEPQLDKFRARVKNAAIAIMAAKSPEELRGYDFSKKAADQIVKLALVQVLGVAPKKIDAAVNNLLSRADIQTIERLPRLAHIEPRPLAMHLIARAAQNTHLQMDEKSNKTLTDYFLKPNLNVADFRQLLNTQLLGLEDADLDDAAFTAILQAFFIPADTCRVELIALAKERGLTNLATWLGTSANITQINQALYRQMHQIKSPVASGQEVFTKFIDANDINTITQNAKTYLGFSAAADADAKEVDPVIADLVVAKFLQQFKQITAKEGLSSILTLLNDVNKIQGMIAKLIAQITEEGVIPDAATWFGLLQNTLLTTVMSTRPADLYPTIRSVISNILGIENSEEVISNQLVKGILQDVGNLMNAKGNEAYNRYFALLQEARQEDARLKEERQTGLDPFITMLTNPKNQSAIRAYVMRGAPTLEQFRTAILKELIQQPTIDFDEKSDAASSLIATTKRCINGVLIPKKSESALPKTGIELQTLGGKEISDEAAENIFKQLLSPMQQHRVRLVHALKSAGLPQLLNFATHALSLTKTRALSFTSLEAKDEVLPTTIDGLRNAITQSLVGGDYSRGFDPSSDSPCRAAISGVLHKMFGERPSDLTSDEVWTNLLTPQQKSHVALVLSNEDKVRQALHAQTTAMGLTQLTAWLADSNPQKLKVNQALNLVVDNSDPVVQARDILTQLFDAKHFELAGMFRFQGFLGQHFGLSEPINTDILKELKSEYIRQLLLEAITSSDIDFAIIQPFLDTKDLAQRASIITQLSKKLNASDIIETDKGHALLKDIRTELYQKMVATNASDPEVVGAVVREVLFNSLGIGINDQSNSFVDQSVVDNETAQKIWNKVSEQLQKGQDLGVIRHFKLVQQAQHEHDRISPAPELKADADEKRLPEENAEGLKHFIAMLTNPPNTSVIQAHLKANPLTLGQFRGGVTLRLANQAALPPGDEKAWTTAIKACMRSVLADEKSTLIITDLAANDVAIRLLTNQQKHYVSLVQTVKREPKLPNLAKFLTSQSKQILQHPTLLDVMPKYSLDELRDLITQKLASKKFDQDNKPEFDKTVQEVLIEIFGARAEGDALLKEVWNNLLTPGQQQYVRLVQHVRQAGSSEHFVAFLTQSENRAAICEKFNKDGAPAFTSLADVRKKLMRDVAAQIAKPDYDPTKSDSLKIAIQTVIENWLGVRPNEILAGQIQSILLKPQQYYIGMLDALCTTNKNLATIANPSPLAPLISAMVRPENAAVGSIQTPNLDGADGLLIQLTEIVSKEEIIYDSKGNFTQPTKNAIAKTLGIDKPSLVNINVGDVPAFTAAIHHLLGDERVRYLKLMHLLKTKEMHSLVEQLTLHRDKVIAADPLKEAKSDDIIGELRNMIAQAAIKYINDNKKNLFGLDDAKREEFINDALKAAIAKVFGIAEGDVTPAAVSEAFNLLTSAQKNQIRRLPNLARIEPPLLAQHLIEMKRSEPMLKVGANIDALNEAIQNCLLSVDAKEEDEDVDALGLMVLPPAEREAASAAQRLFNVLNGDPNHWIPNLEEKDISPNNLMMIRAAFLANANQLRINLYDAAHARELPNLHRLLADANDGIPNPYVLQIKQNLFRHLDLTQQAILQEFINESDPDQIRDVLLPKYFGAGIRVEIRAAIANEFTVDKARQLLVTHFPPDVIKIVGLLNEPLNRGAIIRKLLEPAIVWRIHDPNSAQAYWAEIKEALLNAVIQIDANRPELVAEAVRGVLADKLGIVIAAGDNIANQIWSDVLYTLPLGVQGHFELVKQARNPVTALMLPPEEVMQPLPAQNANLPELINMLLTPENTAAIQNYSSGPPQPPKLSLRSFRGAIASGLRNLPAFDTTNEAALTDAMVAVLTDKFKIQIADGNRALTQEIWTHLFAHGHVRHIELVQALKCDPAANHLNPLIEFLAAPIANRSNAISAHLHTHAIPNNDLRAAIVRGLLDSTFVPPAGGADDTAVKTAIRNVVTGLLGVGIIPDAVVDNIFGQFLTSGQKRTVYMVQYMKSVLPAAMGGGVNAFVQLLIDRREVISAHLQPPAAGAPAPVPPVYRMPHISLDAIRDAIVERTVAIIAAPGFANPDNADAARRIAVKEALAELLHINRDQITDNMVTQIWHNVIADPAHVQQGRYVNLILNLRRHAALMNMLADPANGAAIRPHLQNDVDATVANLQNKIITFFEQGRPAHREDAIQTFLADQLGITPAQWNAVPDKNAVVTDVLTHVLTPQQLAYIELIQNLYLGSTQVQPITAIIDFIKANAAVVQAHFVANPLNNKDALQTAISNHLINAVQADLTVFDDLNRGNAAIQTAVYGVLGVPFPAALAVGANDLMVQQVWDYLLSPQNKQAISRLPLFTKIYPNELANILLNAAIANPNISILVPAQLTPEDFINQLNGQIAHYLCEENASAAGLENILRGAGVGLRGNIGNILGADIAEFQARIQTPFLMVAEPLHQRLWMHAHNQGADIMRLPALNAVLDRATIGINPNPIVPNYAGDNDAEVMRTLRGLDQAMTPDDFLKAIFNDQTAQHVIPPHPRVDALDPDLLAVGSEAAILSGLEKYLGPAAAANDALVLELRAEYIRGQLEKLPVVIAAFPTLLAVLQNEAAGSQVRVAVLNLLQAYIQTGRTTADQILDALGQRSLEPNAHEGPPPNVMYRYGQLLLAVGRAGLDRNLLHNEIAAENQRREIRVICEQQGLDEVAAALNRSQASVVAHLVRGDLMRTGENIFNNELFALPLPHTEDECRVRLREVLGINAAIPRADNILILQLQAFGLLKGLIDSSVGRLPQLNKLLIELDPRIRTEILQLLMLEAAAGSLRENVLHRWLADGTSANIRAALGNNLLALMPPVFIDNLVLELRAEHFRRELMVRVTPPAPRAAAPVGFVAGLSEIADLLDDADPLRRGGIITQLQQHLVATPNLDPSNFLRDLKIKLRDDVLEIDHIDTHADYPAKLADEISNVLHQEIGSLHNVAVVDNAKAARIWVGVLTSLPTEDKRHFNLVKEVRQKLHDLGDDDVAIGASPLLSLLRNPANAHLIRNHLGANPVCAAAVSLAVLTTRITNRLAGGIAFDPTNARERLDAMKAVLAVELGLAAVTINDNAADELGRRFLSRVQFDYINLVQAVAVHPKGLLELHDLIKNNSAAVQAKLATGSFTLDGMRTNIRDAVSARVRANPALFSDANRDSTRSSQEIIGPALQQGITHVLGVAATQRVIDEIWDNLFEADDQKAILRLTRLAQIQPRGLAEKLMVLPGVDFNAKVAPLDALNAAIAAYLKNYLEKGVGDRAGFINQLTGNGILNLKGITDAQKLELFDTALRDALTRHVLSLDIDTKIDAIRFNDNQWEALGNNKDAARAAIQNYFYGLKDRNRPDIAQVNADLLTVVPPISGAKWYFNLSDDQIHAAYAAYDLKAQKRMRVIFGLTATEVAPAECTPVDGQQKAALNRCTDAQIKSVHDTLQNFFATMVDDPTQPAVLPAANAALQKLFPADPLKTAWADFLTQPQLEALYERRFEAAKKRLCDILGIAPTSIPALTLTPAQATVLLSISNTPAANTAIRKYFYGHAGQPVDVDAINTALVQAGISLAPALVDSRNKHLVNAMIPVARDYVAAIALENVKEALVSLTDGQVQQLVRNIEAATTPPSEAIPANLIAMANSGAWHGVKTVNGKMQIVTDLGYLRDAEFIGIGGVWEALQDRLGSQAQNRLETLLHVPKQAGLATGPGALTPAQHAQLNNLTADELGASAASVRRYYSRVLANVEHVTRYMMGIDVDAPLQADAYLDQTQIARLLANRIHPHDVVNNIKDQLRTYFENLGGADPVLTDINNLIHLVPFFTQAQLDATYNAFADRITQQTLGLEPFLPPYAGPYDSTLVAEIRFTPEQLALAIDPRPGFTGVQGQIIQTTLAAYFATVRAGAAPVIADANAQIATLYAPPLPAFFGAGDQKQLDQAYQAFLRRDLETAPRIRITPPTPVTRNIIARARVNKVGLQNALNHDIPATKAVDAITDEQFDGIASDDLNRAVMAARPQFTPQEQKMLRLMRVLDAATAREIENEVKQHILNQAELTALENEAKKVENIKPGGIMVGELLHARKEKLAQVKEQLERYQRFIIEYNAMLSAVPNNHGLQPLDGKPVQHTLAVLNTALQALEQKTAQHQKIVGDMGDGLRLDAKSKYMVTEINPTPHKHTAEERTMMKDWSKISTGTSTGATKTAFMIPQTHFIPSPTNNKQLLIAHQGGCTLRVTPKEVTILKAPSKGKNYYPCVERIIERVKTSGIDLVELVGPSKQVKEMYITFQAMTGKRPICPTVVYDPDKNPKDHAKAVEKRKQELIADGVIIAPTKTDDLDKKVDAVMAKIDGVKGPRMR